MANTSRRALVCGSASLIGLAPMVAAADPKLRALAGLLVDLPGWQAQEPDMMSMTQGALSVAYAARAYERGDMRVMAMLGRSGVEQQVPMVAGQGQSEFSLDAEGTALRLRPLRGFQVFTAFNKADLDGMVMVFLQPPNTTAPSTFILQFEGLSLDDAMKLADRFNWQAMQRAVAAR